MASIFDTPLLELGSQADRIRQNLWGKYAFYVKNMHINFTNICASKCKFCAFGKDKNDKGSYLLSIDDIVRKVQQEAPGVKELHIVGALNPETDLNYYIDMISTLKQEFPDKTLKAFGAVEIDFMAKIASIPISKLLSKLKKAGLDMMPGGGAEIFNEFVRNQICPEKISGERWLKIMETAHSEGLKTNATMLYGHLETNQHREEHLLKLRQLQEKTGGFNAFIPLSFHPEKTAFSHIKKSTAVDDLYVTAAARIILDNIPHIKAYWVMLGEKTAQIALRFGADDLDGTIVQENITFAAGEKTGRGLTEGQLRDLISSAGLEPVERDSFYNHIG